MFVPGYERYTDMTPQEFEVYALDFLQKEASKLEKVNFEHDVMIQTHDGNYQIDGKISFSFMGFSFLCLVECKKYKGPINREKVAALYSKMQSIGAQKGIIVTTSYYQSGAIKFASEHGIALVVLTDEGITYHCRDAHTQDIHLPLPDGSLIMPVWVEAIADDHFRTSYFYDHNNNVFIDFLLNNNEDDRTI